MSAAISNSRILAWTIWLIASIFYAYQYILRVMPAIMLNDLMEQFSMDTATFGQFSGVYYIGYAGMHLPIGMMLDRFGPKKIISACLLLIAMGLSSLIFAHHWLPAMIGRFLVGLGSSAAILGVFKIIRMAFKEERFTRMLSLSAIIGLVGAIYGGGPVDALCKSLGYQAVVLLFGAAGIALAAASYWLIPNIRPTKSSVASDLKEVLSNRKVLLACAFAGLMVGPLEGFADVWGTEFLKQTHGFDSSSAAQLPSMIYLGMCFGSLLLSTLAEKLGSHLLTLVGAGGAMLICFIFLLACSMSSMLVSLNFLIVGIGCAYQILAIYQISSYASHRIAGLTSAVANMIIMIFGYLFHTAIGLIVQTAGDSHALSYGILVIPAALLIGSGGFALFYIQEKKEKRNERLVF